MCDIEILSSNEIFEAIHKEVKDIKESLEEVYANNELTKDEIKFCIEDTLSALDRLSDYYYNKYKNTKDIEMNSIKKENTELHKDNDKLQAKREKLVLKMNSIKKENIKLHKENDKLQAKREDLSLKLNYARSENVRLEFDINNIRKENKRLHEENDSLAESLDKANKKIDEIRDKIKILE